MQNQEHLGTLVNERRAVLDTNEAAFHLGRKPQTLRKWASREDGPIRPLRIHGRLAWRVDDIKRVVGLHVEIK
ncbi:DNA-binding protein [Pseudoduganella sp. R-43]|uniref:DNA-binding protein n=1 Tax=Pseudoduganella sp. R-43 TaxID=3404063 RepID=UPI003CE71D73